jgi:hypothetical protein
MMSEVCHSALSAWFLFTPLACVVHKYSVLAPRHAQCPKLRGAKTPFTASTCTWLGLCRKRACIRSAPNVLLR